MLLANQSMRRKKMDKSEKIKNIANNQEILSVNVWNASKINPKTYLNDHLDEIPFVEDGEDILKPKTIQL